MKELFPNKSDLPLDTATPVHFVAGVAAGSLGLGPLVSILVIQSAKLGYVMLRSGKEGLYDPTDGPLKQSVDTLMQGLGSVIGGAIRKKLKGEGPLTADIRNMSGLGAVRAVRPRAAAPSRSPGAPLAPPGGVPIGVPMDEA
jgi:hypothetical protein